MKRLLASLCLLALLLHGSAALQADVRQTLSASAHCTTPDGESSAASVLQLCLQLCAMPMVQADAAAVPMAGYSPVPPWHGLPAWPSALAKRLFRPPINA